MKYANITTSLPRARVRALFLAIAVFAFIPAIARAEAEGKAPPPPTPQARSPATSTVPANSADDSRRNLESAPPFLLADWTTDFDEARKRAHAENKDIFLLFSSTDSSFWSLRLDTEVLSQPDFGSLLSDVFVFVHLDFPKSYKQPEPEHRKNAALRNSWNVNTFPSVFLADKNGKPYAVTGYRSGTVSDYVAHVKSLQSIRIRRDQHLAALATAVTDAERAVMLSNALREVDESILALHYTTEIRELRRLDPKDSTGLLGDIDFSPRLVRLRAKVFQLVRSKKDYNGAVSAVDQFIQQSPLEGERLQKTLFLKLAAHANNERHDHAAIIALMDAIIAINPETETARTATEVRERARVLLAAAQSSKKQSPKPSSAKQPPAAKGGNPDKSEKAGKAGVKSPQPKPKEQPTTPEQAPSKTPPPKATVP